MRPARAFGATLVSVLLLRPAAARADALDAVGVFAMGLMLIWSLVALPMLATACFARPSSAGARGILGVLLCVTWAPAILFGFAAEAPVLGLFFVAVVVGGLVRLWRALPPDEGVP